MMTAKAEAFDQPLLVAKGPMSIPGVEDGFLPKADDHVGAPGQPLEPPLPQLLGTTSGIDPA